MVPTLLASVLRNAADNSLRNSRTNGNFVPLPTMRELAKCAAPEELSFKITTTPVSQPYEKLHKIAKVNGYHERIEDAFLPLPSN